MVDIEYDRYLDTVNIEVFKRTGFDNSAERRFRCVCCKKRYLFQNVSQVVAAE